MLWERVVKDVPQPEGLLFTNRYIMMLKGRVAQRLEHVATNYGVGGSNPPLPKTFFIFLKDSLF